MYEKLTIEQVIALAVDALATEQDIPDGIKAVLLKHGIWEVFEIAAT